MSSVPSHNYTSNDALKTPNAVLSTSKYELVHYFDQNRKKQIINTEKWLYVELTNQVTSDKTVVY